MAVRRRLETGRHLHDLGVPAAVALGEEAPASSQLACGLGRVEVGARRDGHVPFGVVEVIDAPIGHDRLLIRVR